MKNFILTEVERWKNINDDYRRWVYLKGSGVFMVMLDNDETYVVLSEHAANVIGYLETEIINESLPTFDNYIGWHDGVQTLLKSFGINYDVV